MTGSSPLQHTWEENQIGGTSKKGKTVEPVEGWDNV